MDNASLQDDIISLTAWSENWQLLFNESKCKCLHIGKETTASSYHMNSHLLENVTEEKDLGVIVDNKLKFHMHTSAAIKKANSILGLIKRSFAELDESTITTLYTSMVLPHLEYGNVIWVPHFKEDIKAIERLQKRATKFVPKLKNLPYIDRLLALNLPSLSYRRKRGDMIMYYKIMTEKQNINKEEFFTINERDSRGHKLKIMKTQQAIKQARCQSFAIKAVTDWNNLPSEVVQVHSVNDFKNKLDGFWLHKKFESPYIYET